jgi:DNA mismatch endonuclease, patch repair protein
MRRVKSTNTSPELKVRSLLHRLGFRFRLHRKDLPGSPDIILPKHRTAIFVHGCFWHRHAGCHNASTPSSRQEYWMPKFLRNVERDRKNQEKLRLEGWQVIVVWECETRDLEKLEQRMSGLFSCGPLAEQWLIPSLAMAAEKSGQYNAVPKPKMQLV